MINVTSMVMIYRRESFNCINSPLKVKLGSFEVKYSKYKTFSNSVPPLYYQFKIIKIWKPAIWYRQLLGQIPLMYDSNPGISVSSKAWKTSSYFLKTWMYDQFWDHCLAFYEAWQLPDGLSFSILS